MQPQTPAILQPDQQTPHRFTTSMLLTRSSLQHPGLWRWRHVWTLFVAWILLAGAGAAIAQNLKGWDEWKSAFLQPDGRVIDTGQNNISHSEGQGFGLLLATAANDRAAFETMWAWTQKNLGVRTDGLFAWRWEPGKGVTDPNNATDGDLFIAWALQRAADKFKQPAYKDQSAALSKAIRGRMVVDGTPWGTVIKPGAVGFDTPQGPIVNLSYWVFPAFDALNAVDPHPQWDALTTSGLRLVEIARFGRWQLPPDWLLLVNPLQLSPNHAPRYGYDAVRIPLYLYWARKMTPGHLAPFQQFWTHFKCESFLPGWVNLADNSIDSYGAGAGVQSIRGLLTTGKTLPARAFMSTQGYYPATLGLMAEVAAREGSRK